MRSASAGFVLVDALMAVVVASAVGVVAVSVGVNLLQSQDRQLDRTVALATMHQIAKEVLLTGPAAMQGYEDELYVYELIQQDGHVGLAQFSVSARPKSAGQLITLAFLAPTEPGP